jgi:hypothetical protein
MDDGVQGYVRINATHNRTPHTDTHTQDRVRRGKVRMSDTRAGGERVRHSL